ncbi:uncharacterized protein LOC110984083 isoform X2 [Acanthaster planci]|uniref:Uncharacterized protein LOC110984083 isoform X2 n=1 Tax=Acanthaster planci TaxID=133434 RepID=A0A8B7Z1V9_ACAPL|nr:uncharacterized protein LOC110984083 isoform X2 [Acanthaster planci]
MAIMQRCCCFDNVRSGSNASAIYTLIYSAIVLAFAAWQISVLVASGVYIYLPVDGVFVAYCLGVALYALILIFSVLVLVGVSKDQRGFLLPYMIVMPVLILLQIAQCIILIVNMAARDSYYGYNYAKVGIAFGIVQLVIVVLFTVLDVFCFLCVTSQYQELRDGRGRLQDVIAARTHTVVTTTPGVGGAVIVTQQTGPPQQGYAMQEGYPPQQGYATQQGYAPQQGYPAQQGYAPQQGYPAQEPIPPKV